MEAVTGAFEIHIFVEPLDPPAEAIERFRAACAAHGMKALLLELDYRDKGFVGVLQSSRYVSGEIDDAIAAAHADAAALRDAGLTVLREKVEAMASDDGVPKTADDATRSPADRYFEFHILVDRTDRALSEDDVRGLRAIAARWSDSLGTPVPLSYNALKPAQRFLNLRARGVGLDRAMEPVRALERELADSELVVKKVIAEYICFDSNRAVDNGWLEP
jgi:hypothetical protein